LIQPTRNVSLIYPDKCYLFFRGYHYLTHTSESNIDTFDQNELPEVILIDDTFSSQQEVIEYLLIPDNKVIYYIPQLKPDTWYFEADQLMYEAGSCEKWESEENFRNYKKFLKYEVKEMTMDEIEELVGRKVKIVGKK
jgi:hypothetical protein